jgi:hypothetical protein
MLIVTGCLAAVYAGSGARGSATPDVPVKIQGAIALELQALREEGKLDLVGAEKKLAASRALLQSTLPQLTDSVYSAARHDVTQAEHYDERAIKDLKKYTKKTLLPEAPVDIKIAINHKYGALEAFGFEHTFFNGTPPPVDAPPVVTSFQADLAPPNTTFKVVATDPDDVTLSYLWMNTNSCGTFTWNVNSPTASWYHGEDSTCSHDGPYHPGIITVTVADKHSSCTVIDPNGSLSVAPYDPGEDCKKLPPPTFRTGADKATVQGLLDKVDSAIDSENLALDAKGKWKKSKFQEAALKSAGILKGLETDLTDLLATYPQDADVQSIFDAVHAAEEIDLQAVLQAGLGLKGARKTLTQALPKKKAAQTILKGILNP